MLKRVAILALMSFAVLSAKTYTFTISEAAHTSATQLAPGDYKVKLDGQKPILEDSRGHQINTPMKVQTSKRKFDNTAVTVSNAKGTTQLESIELRGTHDRVVFE
ncbi:MAG: hypothetical protein IT160_05835 [Bryobacterales bacterium]|nr:hypothetical protein [Bryobacterales bacterium]